jgi:iron complex outermembrane receptor protein
VDYRWQDRVGSYTTFSGDINDYTPYALVDAHLEWSTKLWTVFTDVNNVMNNHSYVDFGNVAQPGRWIVSGVKIKL